MRWLKIAWGFLFHSIRAHAYPKPKLLEENQTAPNFALQDESGQTHRLSDYFGKKVVLWFFLRARTPG
jgi:AhpC/TSA family